MLDKIPTLNYRHKINGLELLDNCPNAYSKLVFFDPQYRGIMDKQKYGNEGARQKERALLPQMSDEVIHQFLIQIERVLTPSGHLMLWVDKFILCSQLGTLFSDVNLQIVSLITWNKKTHGYGDVSL